ncbi:hypothetical protein BH24ACT5_BH24ACT5_09180 [soil metagenome]
MFCDITELSVQDFQRHRGLHDHGICDEATWLALVEASWRLGDRPLKLLAPHLRGDDVALLQSQLNKLVFDCGRVDGILGPRTARALEDFQRNCGLEVDAVCGPGTARALERNSARTGSGPGVAAVRELDQLGHSSTSLAELRVVVGQFGGLSTLARSVARDLRHRGAKVISVDDLDPSQQAAAANRHAAHVYVGFEAEVDPRASVAFYRTEGFESAGGRSLAGCLARGLQDALAGVDTIPTPTARGMRLPVLRETRMTAVLCSLGPVQPVTDAGSTISDAAMAALTSWAASPTVSEPVDA